MISFIKREKQPGIIDGTISLKTAFCTYLVTILS